MWNFYGGEVDLTFFFFLISWLVVVHATFSFRLFFSYLSRMEKHVYMLCFAFFCLMIFLICLF